MIIPSLRERKSRVFHYRIKRLTRWVKEFIKEYPPSTKLDNSVLKYLSMMSCDGTEWTQCHNRDALECTLFIFMEGPTGKRKDCQYYYGRVRFSGIAFYLFIPLSQKRVLKEETEDIICEMLTLIEEGAEDGMHTGQVWNPNPS